VALVGFVVVDSNVDGFAGADEDHPFLGGKLLCYTTFHDTTIKGRKVK